MRPWSSMAPQMSVAEPFPADAIGEQGLDLIERGLCDLGIVIEHRRPRAVVGIVGRHDWPASAKKAATSGAYSG